MVTTGFADRGLFGAETESARKGLPGRAVSVVECVCSGADATPSPSRRGLKHVQTASCDESHVRDATPSPSRRGLKHEFTAVMPDVRQRCNTVPIEKGTETLAAESTRSARRRRCNTVPIEKGTETEIDVQSVSSGSRMQHRPHREGD